MLNIGRSGTGQEVIIAGKKEVGRKQKGRHHLREEVLRTRKVL